MSGSDFAQKIIDFFASIIKKIQEFLEQFGYGAE